MEKFRSLSQLSKKVSEGELVLFDLGKNKKGRKYMPLFLKGPENDADNPRRKVLVFNSANFITGGPDEGCSLSEEYHLRSTGELVNPDYMYDDNTRVQVGVVEAYQKIPLPK